MVYTARRTILKISREEVAKEPYDSGRSQSRFALKISFPWTPFSSKNLLWMGIMDAPKQTSKITQKSTAPPSILKRTQLELGIYYIKKSTKRFCAIYLFIFLLFTSLSTISLFLTKWKRVFLFLVGIEEKVWEIFRSCGFRW